MPRSLSICGYLWWMRKMHRLFRVVHTAKVTTASYSTHPVRESRQKSSISYTNHEKEI
jgi:hypothetical protein